MYPLGKEKHLCSELVTWRERVKEEESPAKDPSPALSAIDYDYVVIGSGSGGLVSVSQAAKLDARVTVVESHKLVDTCMNVQKCTQKEFPIFSTSFHLLRQVLTSNLSPGPAKSCSLDQLEHGIPLVTVNLRSWAKEKETDHLDSVMSSDDCKMAIRAGSLEEEAQELQASEVSGGF
ncbi:Glutathione reductase, mitochondrial [Myotis davidii]|uniref:Glutathione reductase, mitochondrial n=1 Tax=Myotis davidii TaxID=225400 RepID=L5MEG7_MYODS|nr:Glutathione reductase, mitochondrial [Myotis davidii]